MKERQELKMFKKNKLIVKMMTMIKMGSRRVELKGYDDDDDFITIIFTVFCIHEWEQEWRYFYC